MNRNYNKKSNKKLFLNKDAVRALPLAEVTPVYASPADDGNNSDSGQNGGRFC
jgi:hypothetical protein